MSGSARPVIRVIRTSPVLWKASPASSRTMPSQRMGAIFQMEARIATRIGLR